MYVNNKNLKVHNIPKIFNIYNVMQNTQKYPKTYKLYMIIKITKNLVFKNSIFIKKVSIKCAFVNI